MTLTFRYSDQAKVDWTGGNNKKGGTINEKIGCPSSGRYNEKRKTETEMGGQREERFGGSGWGVEIKSDGKGCVDSGVFGGRSLGHDATLT